MNKFQMTDMQNYLEENSRYCALLQERHINEQKYSKNLQAIQRGLDHLGIPLATIKIFENRTNLIIHMGYGLSEYAGYELPLYIAYKKKNLPVPEDLLKKCPEKLIALIDSATGRQAVNEFQKELQDVSLSPDIFLIVHKSIMSARVESLLPNQLPEFERLAAINMKEALKKIPSIYINYLSVDSYMKIIKKIASGMREMKNKFEEETKNIDLYTLRLKEQMQELYLETTEGLRAIVESEVEKGADVGIITEKISNLFSRLDRLFLGNIYHLRDYQKRKKEIQLFLKQEEESGYDGAEKILDKKKKIAELYDEYMFFNNFGPLNKDEDKVFSKILIQECEQLYRQKSQDLSILQKFEKKGLLSVQLEFEAIKEAYDLFMKRIIIPNYLGQCFLDIVNYLPPASDEPPRVINDIANLNIFAFEGKNILNLVKNGRNYPKGVAEFIETLRKCITILIYDIRGSSYMGIKLHDAIKEQKIKYKFAREMAKIVKKYDGFLLKDTGDGGLVWFSENSGSLYKHLYTESITGKGMKLRHSIFSGAEFDLIPALDAAKRAILCARDMVLRAEEFIRANFMHYREWFADVAERTLELDGITYALLPPEFKSLFRIGIGIASGIPDRDVVLAANSYGDPDLFGPVLSDAHLYSMERQPGRSVIICDLPTIINLILNIENFEYEVVEKDFEQYIQVVEELRKKTHGYKFSDHKIDIAPRGIHLLEELDKKRALADKYTDLFIDENNRLYNEQKKKVKLIYEVLNIS